MSLLRETSAAVVDLRARATSWLRRGILIALALAGVAAIPLHSKDVTRAPEGYIGRYQLTHVGRSDAWVILDTETGKFEHWVPVAGTSKYHVFGCKFGEGCSITDKRSVDRGLDP